MGFNEVFTSSAMDLNHYAINYGVFNASSSGTFGGYQHNPYVNFAYCVYPGEVRIRMIVEANISTTEGKLGVVAEGDCTLVDRFYSDIGTVYYAQKQTFTKWVFGTPMISPYLTGTLADVNYISIGTNLENVIVGYRIRTRRIGKGIV